MNDLEKEFLSSLRALFKRYGVKVEKGYTGFDDEAELTHIFSNDEFIVGEKEIYLDLNEFMNYLNSE